MVYFSGGWLRQSILTNEYINTIEKEKKRKIYNTIVSTGPSVNKYCAASEVCYVILDHWASHQYILLFSEQIDREQVWSVYAYLFHGQ